MISLTPMEEFYLTEIVKDKSFRQIAKENNIKEHTIAMIMYRLKKRLKLSKLKIILKFINKKYEVKWDGQKYKSYDEVMASKEAILSKKLGFKDREIIKELRERVY